MVLLAGTRAALVPVKMVGNEMPMALPVATTC